MKPIYFKRHRFPPDQRADIAVKRRDGKCFSYVVEFEQKHQGSGYGGTYMASRRDMEMLCENVAR